MEIKTVLCLCCAFFSVLFACNNVTANVKKWAWLHKKVFSKQEIARNRKKEVLFFEKKDINLFSQLIFSWNSFRPKKGHFTFYVQGRDAKTKKWGAWHKMVQWGAEIQKSCFSGNGKTKYVYVRLEPVCGNSLDGFRLKIDMHQGANLGLLRGFFVSTSDFSKFKCEAVGKRLCSLSSVILKNVAKKSQRVLDHPDSARLCSPTSCSMLSEFFLNRFVDPVDFAKYSFDHGLNDYGSWPFNVAHAFEVCKGKVLFYTSRLNSFVELHGKLIKKVPVVVSVRGNIEGAQKNYKQGHLMVVIGWDAKKQEVICHDPAFYSDEGVLVRYEIKSFLRAWERSRRLVYIPNIEI